MHLERHRFTVAGDDFFDMIAGIQGSRMNDQRANLSDFPGLQDSEVVMAPFIAEHMIVNHTSLDDQFFEMLMKCQVGAETTVVTLDINFTYI